MIGYLPNFLSVLRIIIAFFLFYTIRAHLFNESLWLIVCSGMTDFLDGYLARCFKHLTDLGSLLDPFADKVFFLCLFLALTLENLMPVWAFVIFIGRDFAIVLAAAFLKYYQIPYRFTPTLLSKINTTLQFLYGINILAFKGYYSTELLYIIVITTIVSGILYMHRFIKTRI